MAAAGSQTAASGAGYREPMGPQLVVRDATGGDVEVLCDLRRDMFTELGRVPGAWATASRPALYRMLDNGSVLAVVAEYSRDVVGIGLAFLDTRLPAPGRPHGLKAHVGCLYTVPERRGAGAASAVLARLLARARECGADQVELFASEAGKGVYAAFGFRPVGAPLQQLSFVLAPPGVARTRGC